MQEEVTLIKAIGRAAKMLDNHFNEEISAHELNLTRVQFIALKIISNQEVTSQNNLAFLTSRDKTSLARLLNTLEKKNYITRSTSSDDKRVKLLSITEAGRTELKKVAPIILGVEQHVTKGIQRSDIETTVHVLNQVFAKVKPEHIV